MGLIMAASLATVPGGTVDFSDEQLADLGMLFRGPLIGPGDSGYDEIRVVENLAINRQPGLIIRCSGTADVIDGVNLAREHGSCSRFGVVGTTSPVMEPSMVVWCSTCGT
jgi:hypothetical protein